MKKLSTQQPPVVLIILDGFGLRDSNLIGNAITHETAPKIFSYMNSFPNTPLVAHGKAVGLFNGNPGNSEAGHLCIGAGSVVKQDLVRISDDIENGLFFKNTAFLDAVDHAKTKHSNVHLMGMLTNHKSGHARIEHLISLIKLFKEKGQKNIYLHLFTDGRDSPVYSATEYLKVIEPYLDDQVQIASIMGRFYAMDRNKMWDRTRQAYELLVLGKGTCAASSVEEAISQSYNRSETDEFICPTVILKSGKPVGVVSDNDVLVFFNARSDRARQLTKTFVQNDFHKDNPGSFKRVKRPKNVLFVAMSEFGPDLPGILTAFPSVVIKDTIATAIGESRPQVYVSETEKYAHVTYFINGGHAKPVNGERREMIKSTHIKDLADHPKMSGVELTNLVIKEIKKGIGSFVCINYPQVDMLGHTGNFEAAKKAVGFIDEQVALIVDEVMNQDGVVVVTADHGNAEEMIDLDTNEIKTSHTTNPVPFILISEKFKKSELRDGSLKDVTPTLLDVMGLKKPKAMTGKSLIVQQKNR
jgi:2,3-bisphosphoglycerate-independent phosphoglycerate mutase